MDFNNRTDGNNENTSNNNHEEASKKNDLSENVKEEEIASGTDTAEIQSTYEEKPKIKVSLGVFAVSLAFAMIITFMMTCLIVSNY